MLPSTYNFPCTRQGSWSYLSVTFSRHFHFSGRVASPAQPAAWTGPKPREGFGLNGTAWKTVDRPRPGVKTDAVSSGDTPTAARSHAAHETGHPRLSIFSQTLKRLHGQPPSHSQQVSGESLDTTEPKLRPTNTKGSIMPSGNKNERPSKLRKAAPVFPEDDATRQLGRSTDASNLPRMPTLDVGHKRVVSSACIAYRLVRSLILSQTGPLRSSRLVHSPRSKQQEPTGSCESSFPSTSSADVQHTPKTTTSLPTTSFAETRETKGSQDHASGFHHHQGSCIQDGP